MIKVSFYIEYPYYFPHFLPISEYLKNKNIEVIYILSDEQNTNLMIEIAKENKLNYKIGRDELFHINSNYVFFANYFNDTNKIKAITLFMDHGVGTKYCNYEKALEQFDIVLVEGEYRYNDLLKNHQSKANNIKKVGFSKLDGVINFTQEEKEKYINKYSLDINKKTILYAPTFFPSSIEKMSDIFPEDFKDYNIIVKPHYLSFHRSRYKNQIKKFDKWNKYQNCVVVTPSEYSLVPFLSICDVMISDESSAIFEFTALNKPVILNKFLKLRWSYYLNPKKLLKRMDQGIDMYRSIGDNANNYNEMVKMVNDNINNKDKYEEIRIKYTKDICGVVDGKVSERIYELIKKVKEND